jgi:Fe-Mn family superoxide dismutase
VYVDNLNKAILENKITETSLEKLLAKVSTMPAAIRNHGGGHYNHSMFWQLMKPNGGGQPTGMVNEAINAAFGSFDAFKTKFADAGKGRFGSGWAWLVRGTDGKLTITSTANQDNPLMDIAEVKGTPIMCLDVWEHAYYLKYQNKRPDYINAWWNVVNWDEVARRMA